MKKIPLLSEKLGKRLRKNKWIITTAESCTAGGISRAITDVANSSDYFEQAFITYSNSSKHQLLGVDDDVLQRYGAVSQQTVEKMAQGALKKARANVAIAVSGIAGPGGGTEDKPVGTVWLSIAIKTKQMKYKEANIYSEKFVFRGDRSSIRKQTVQQALLKTLDIIKSQYKIVIQ